MTIDFAGVTDSQAQPLPAHMRVLGLPRKSKNGTTFRLMDGRYAERKVKNPPLGYASVVRTLRDGTVIAQVQGGGLVSFNTKNTTVWPHAASTLNRVVVQEA
jgi:hypothetical protein